MTIESPRQAELALADLAEQLERWRQSRATGQERIPLHWWDQAVGLATRLPCAQVARRLHLRSTDLRRLPGPPRGNRWPGNAARRVPPGTPRNRGSCPAGRRTLDLSIRITDHLEPTDIARKLGACRLCAVASPDYLAGHGRPTHPAELKHHECLNYTSVPNHSTWLLQVEGRPESVPVRSRLSANNGEALMTVAAAGMGIALQPDFIVAPFLAAGTVEALLESFAPPPLGIYVLLPSNRYLPYRFRVFIDFLVAQLAQPNLPAPGPQPVPGTLLDGGGTV